MASPSESPAAHSELVSVVGSEVHGRLRGCQRPLDACLDILRPAKCEAPQIAHGECFMSSGSVGILGDRFLKEPSPLLAILFCEPVQMPGRTLQLACMRQTRVYGDSSLDFSIYQNRFNRRDDRRANLVLKIESVFERAVKPLGPYVLIVVAVDQLHRHTGEISCLSDAAFD